MSLYPVYYYTRYVLISSVFLYSVCSYIRCYLVSTVPWACEYYVYKGVGTHGYIRVAANIKVNITSTRYNIIISQNRFLIYLQAMNQTSILLQQI